MDALVSSDWLAAHRRDPDLRVLDGSWHMPQTRRDARGEFLAAHLPGAAFFDIDGIADHSNPLPHMLPTPESYISHEASYFFVIFVLLVAALWFFG